MMEIMTRNQAHARGDTKFYTGRPCKNGHLTYRYVQSGTCRDCLHPTANPTMSVAKLEYDKMVADGRAIYDGMVANAKSVIDYANEIHAALIAGANEALDAAYGRANEFMVASRSEAERDALMRRNELITTTANRERTLSKMPLQGFRVREVDLDKFLIEALRYANMVDSVLTVNDICPRRVGIRVVAGEGWYRVHCAKQHLTPLRKFSNNLTPRDNLNLTPKPIPPKVSK